MHCGLDWSPVDLLDAVWRREVHVDYVETAVCFAVQTCMAVKPRVNNAVYASSLQWLCV